MTYVSVQEKNATPSCIIIEMHLLLFSPFLHPPLLHIPPPYFNSFILSFFLSFIYLFIYFLLLFRCRHLQCWQLPCVRQQFNSIQFQNQVQVQAPYAYLANIITITSELFYILIPSHPFSLLRSTPVFFSCKLICVRYTSILFCTALLQHTILH